eukprot:6793317-Ditylum_brightwellii.AAC.1
MVFVNCFPFAGCGCINVKEEDKSQTTESNFFNYKKNLLLCESVGGDESKHQDEGSEIWYEATLWSYSERSYEEFYEAQSNEYDIIISLTEDFDDKKCENDPKKLHLSS